MKNRPALTLALLIFIPGLGISSWVTRSPDLRDVLGASTVEIGLILLGLSLGSMIGILSSGPLVARLGTRPVILTATASIVGGVAIIGLGGAFAQGFVVATGLFFFGLGMGGGEVGLNVAGAEIERQRGKDFLPTLHGCFSLGTTVGAGAGIACTAMQVPVSVHLGVAAAVAAVMLLAAAPGVVVNIGRQTAATPTGPRSQSVLRDPKLLVIGAVVLAMAFAEGTANDWLPLVMVDGHGFDPASGSAMYALFAVAMTVGRFTGGWLSAKIARSVLLAASAMLGAVGLALVIFVDGSPAVLLGAIVLWGLGASLGFPLALSAAGASGENSAARVSFASIVGYMAFLVGPPLLGVLGEEVGLRNAMIVVLVVVGAAIFAAPATRPRQNAPVVAVSAVPEPRVSSDA
nr:MFS transporter [Naasia sp. SYSU D00057]